MLSFTQLSSTHLNEVSDVIVLWGALEFHLVVAGMFILLISSAPAVPELILDQISISCISPIKRSLGIECIPLNGMKQFAHLS